MPEKSEHLLQLYDKDGQLHSVVLSAELWRKAQGGVLPVLNLALEELCPRPPAPEPLEQWREFREYWDFKYPFNAEVQCLGCGSKSVDWQADEPRLFRLKSAQLGGLAVFECLTCQATVRKKHFKDHVCFEFSPAGPGCACR